MTSLLNQTPQQNFSALGFSRATLGFGREKLLPVMERAVSPTPVEATQATLPSFATANDLRDLIRYLKKHPGGVTIVEALGEVKKRILDPHKIAAYEAWGVINRAEDRLELSRFGWEFARKFAAEAMLFRSILDREAPYRKVLEQVQARQLKLLTQADVARIWRAQFAEALDLRQPKSVESEVICFLHLCQAAELGSLTIGKRGQPARLRTDLDEIAAFVNQKWEAWEEEIGAPSAPPVPPAVRSSSASLLVLEPRRLRLCLSGCPSPQNAAHLQSLLELLGLESEILERGELSTVTQSEAAFEIMRRCDAGLFVVTVSDCYADAQGILQLKPDIQAEISAGYLFYHRRVVLLWDERVSLPTIWNTVPRCKLIGQELTWESGLEVARAVQALK